MRADRALFDCLFVVRACRSLPAGDKFWWLSLAGKLLQDIFKPSLPGQRVSFDTPRWHLPAGNKFRWLLLAGSTTAPLALTIVKAAIWRSVFSYLRMRADRALFDYLFVVRACMSLPAGDKFWWLSLAGKLLHGPAPGRVWVDRRAALFDDF